MPRLRPIPVDWEHVAPVRVLVVDDDADLRACVSLQLQFEGYEVLEACDGAEAIDMTREWHPDGIVLDLRMPVMSGVDALPHLREAWPTTAVVVFSAEPSRQVLDSLIASGADAVVEKTAAPDVLKDVLALSLVARQPG